MKEKDLEIYDVWKAPTGNLFIKLSDNYSIAIGQKGHHDPLKEWDELKHTQYVKSHNFVNVKKLEN